MGLHSGVSCEIWFYDFQPEIEVGNVSWELLTANLFSLLFLLYSS